MSINPIDAKQHFRLIKVTVSKIIKTNDGLYETYMTTRRGKTIYAGLWSHPGRIGAVWYYDPVAPDFYSYRYANIRRKLGHL